MRQFPVLRWGIWLAVGVLTVSMTGCTDAAVGATQQSAINLKYQVGPARTLIACADVTGSVSQALVNDSKDYYARTVEVAPRAGGGEVHSFLRIITHDSEDPANNERVTKFGAIPVPQHPTVNPFAGPKAKARAAAVYRAAVARAQTRLHSEQAQARREGQTIRSLRLPRDPTGTDLMSCPAVAQRIFANVPAGSDKELLIISDLVPNGQTSAPSSIKHLAGVHVTIFLYCATPDQECQQRSGYMDHILTHAGATSVVTHDITEISVSSSIW
jgi:hypothetical protein